MQGGRSSHGPADQKLGKAINHVNRHHRVVCMKSKIVSAVLQLDGTVGVDIINPQGRQG
jgi:hypothetical protein